LKTCSVCRIEKPKSDFNWRNKSKGWLRPECRLCHRARERAARHRDLSASNAAAKERKRRWRAANPAAGKLWYEAHREQEAARKAQALAIRGDAIRAAQRAKYHKDPSKHRAASRAWAERNRERVREYHKQYCVAHLAELNEKSRRRRALKLKRCIACFTAVDVDARMSVFGYRCAYCDGPFEHVDHVIPLARGGLHCLANLRPACRTCNLRKSAKPMRVWLSEVA
jgi:5-methylcytosine-specific restriction endonuclease McrA